ncbi:TPA: hypothetical protein DCR79_01715 [Patescibacteria group bacterium]|nr:hypothetical protein [Patescibacteria group bacterium]
MENEWDTAAEEYSQLVGESGDVWRRMLNNPAILREVSGLSKSSKVLDLGCGEGYLSRLLSQYNWELVGVDNSQTLLDEAKRKQSPGDFILADITQPLLLGDDFDVVITNMVLMSVPDIEPVYRNVYNCLKKDGKFIVVIIHPAFRRPIAEFAKTIIDKVFRREPFMKIANNYMIVAKYSRRIMQCVNATRTWHRPMSVYIQKAIDCGFKLIKIDEIAPSVSDLNKWHQPKFLAKYPNLLFMVFTKSE